MLCVKIPGRPQGKGRARTVRRGNFVHSYTPEKTENYENFVKMLTLQEMEKTGTSMILGPISVNIVAYYDIPKSTSKRKRADMANGLLKPVKKPDADNIAKVVGDALNGIVYKDDSQICDLHITKHYTTQEPSVLIYIEPLAG